MQLRRPGLRSRPRPGETTQGQAPRGEGRTVREGALRHGRGVQGPDPPQGRSGTLES